MSKLEAAMRLTGVGFFIGGSIVLGVFAGHWLDDKLKTVLIFTIVGLFVGLAVAGVGVYRMLLPLLANNDNKKGDS